MLTKTSGYNWLVSYSVLLCVFYYVLSIWFSVVAFVCCAFVPLPIRQTLTKLLWLLRFLIVHAPVACCRRVAQRSVIVKNLLSRGCSTCCRGCRNRICLHYHNTHMHACQAYRRIGKEMSTNMCLTMWWGICICHQQKTAPLSRHNKTQKV